MTDRDVILETKITVHSDEYVSTYVCSRCQRNLNDSIFWCAYNFVANNVPNVKTYKSVYSLNVKIGCLEYLLLITEQDI